MSNAPISIVIFGITGDLARNKLLPSLFDLYRKGKLEGDFNIIGYGRKDLSREDFSSLAHEAAFKKSKDNSPFALRQRRHFIDKCHYVQGELGEKEGYDRLRSVINTKGRVIFFLSVHPELHLPIISQLGKEKLLKKNSQIMIEKPFGHDVKTAKTLDAQLRKFVTEDQIYRIDHYLGKAALIDLVQLRKENQAFEKAIETNLKEVNVTLLETKTITGRGAFYDAVGVLKDVGQNHLLQMLAAAIASKNIFSDDAKKVRKARANAIDSLRLKLPAVRAQYEGYHNEPGVLGESRTETFFSISATSTLPKHSKIKLSLSAGKALSENQVNIQLIFKKPLTLGKEKVSKIEFSLNSMEKQTEVPMDAYERIFLAALEKDLSFFCSLDEVIAGWKFDSNVRKFWKSKKILLQRYCVGESIHIPKRSNA